MQADAEPLPQHRLDSNPQWARVSIPERGGRREEGGAQGTPRPSFPGGRNYILLIGGIGRKINGTLEVATSQPAEAETGSEELPVHI